MKLKYRILRFNATTFFQETRKMGKKWGWHCFCIVDKLVDNFDKNDRA